MILLAVIAIVLIAASLVADYQWRKWIAERRRDRDPNTGPNPRPDRD
jgi:hypothetical protein